MFYFIEYFQYLLNYQTSNTNKLRLLIKSINKNAKLTIKRILLNLKKYSNLELINKIEEIDCEKVFLFKRASRHNIIEKPFINEKSKIFQQLVGDVPDIEICLLKNITTLSKSSSLIYNNQIYNYSLSKMKVFHDLKNPLNQVITSFSKKKVSVYFKNSTKFKKEYCIHLLNEHSHNYYHFMFELLPKFILISEVLTINEQFSDFEFTVLLDEKSPYQFIEALKYFSIIKYKIKFVQKRTKLQCENLIFCSDFWISLDNTNFVPNVSNEFFVDKFVCEKIKNKKVINAVVPNRKIYFQRKINQGRYLSNTEELETALQGFGFEFILPETLSFQEQVDIFNEAEIIIGISGAVFSNIIFMQKNTNAIIFSPNTVAANYYIFQPMADVANVNLVHVLTKNSFNESIHANSYVDVSEVASLLKSLNIK